MNLKKGILIAFLILLIVAILSWLFGYRSHLRVQPIKVGILHSLSGTMAISEKAVVEGELMAIDEINSQGGLLGRPIEPVIVDGASDSKTFVKLAEKLITKDKVSVVFGCWTSSCRKTVKPIFEKYRHLLFYPLQYEGLEDSPYIVYLGAAPNQQILPALKWSIDNIGKRFYLVGSDYVFPHTANEIIKDQMKVLGGEVMKEDYVLLGASKAAVLPIVRDIARLKPDMILNTINGDTNAAFFEALREAGITPEKIPVMSFSIAEGELATMKSDVMAGNYAAWNYFQNIDSEKNREFVENFKKKYGENRVTDDPIESGYLGVKLWAQAVKHANSVNTDMVQRSIKNQSFHAPEGPVYIHATNQHTWRNVRIGKIRKDGQFDIVWKSLKPIEPIPYPSSRTRDEWNRFLQDLYQKWDNNWVNPGKKD